MFEHDSEEILAKRRFTRRAAVAALGHLAGFSLLGWRLFQLQVVGHGRYAPLADENRIGLQVLAPKRGRILDRVGVVLADNDETFRATLVPSLSGDPAAVLANFHRVVPLATDEAEKIVRRLKKQSRHSAMIIASDLSFDQVARINVLAPHLPGVRTEVSWRRKYLPNAAIGHVVGYVGNVEKASAEDDALMRLPGMRIGKSGIELSFESDLRGQGGSQKIEVDARGRIVRTLEGVEAKVGQDVVLSIDAVLQQKVSERLSSERRAACVAIDVSTGEIAAMASVPGFDSAEIADGISDESWRRLAEGEDKALLNRAIAGQYAPGGTFKLVTALAALQRGTIDEASSIDCTGRFEMGDHAWRCSKSGGHGPIALHEALAQSCDVYFLELARRLSAAALSDAARSLGFGQLFPRGLQQQKAGLLPDAEGQHPQPGEGADGNETVLAGIGQRDVLVTPLQLCVMAARIAASKAVVPTLLKVSPNGPSAPFVPLAFEERFLEAVRRGMTSAVNDEAAPGRQAQLGGGQPIVAGITAAALVSSWPSETEQSALAWDDRDNSIFVGFVPAAAPRFAVAAVVEHGGNASTAAAVVRDVMTAMLERYQPALLPDDGPDAAKSNGRHDNRREG